MTYKSTDSCSTLLAKVARNKMHQGIAKIVFVKADGTVRTAIATTSDEVVAAQTKSHRYDYDENHTPFFDVRIGRWRSFRNDRLLSVESVLSFNEVDE